MKTFLNMALSGLVDKLYEVAPSLNDSKISGSNSNTTEEQKPGVDDHVIRYILREFLVWKADTETLARASQTSNIDKFVRHSTTDELEEYIKLFEVLGRPDTLRFLRDAVYDYLLPDGSPSTVTILGASISTDTAGRRMTFERWDILHSYFCDPPYQQFVTQAGTTTGKESRCYLVGRMGRSDPLALPFIKEMSTRVARFIVRSIDMDGTCGLVASIRCQ